MTVVGLISDTHGHWDAAYLKHFSDCDEVWHLGDVGNIEIIHQLKALKPVRAVRGNIDNKISSVELPDFQMFDLEQLKFLLIHIAGPPGKFIPEVSNLIKNYTPQAIVCGHSHICKVQRLSVYNQLWYINPGAAGHHGFHQMRTLLKMKVDNGKIVGISAIELGRRGSISNKGTA
jgi:putative phosphoesterase